MVDIEQHVRREMRGTRGEKGGEEGEDLRSQPRRVALSFSTPDPEPVFNSQVILQIATIPHV